jgi:hypothetical protein
MSVAEMKEPHFPYPGVRVLSRWVGDEVKRQFRKDSSTDEILAAVRKVLDAHEEKYGERPSAPESDDNPLHGAAQLTRAEGGTA